MKNNIFFKALMCNMKSIKLLFRRYPRVFVIYGMSACFSALTPYVYLFFSARIINNLVAVNMGMVWKLVAYIIFITCVLGLIGNQLSHAENYNNSIFMTDKESLYMEKLISLKFKDLDDSSTFDVLSKISLNS